MRKNIAILLFDEVEVLDFAGPFEVFSLADGLSKGTLFNVFTVGVLPGIARARNGLKIVPDYLLATCPRVDVLVVPGGNGTRALMGQAPVLEWIRRVAQHAELVVSVCTGSLLLAKADLLNGLRITTHHTMLKELVQLAPRSIVDPSARFHDNGKFIVAAGISAGIDGALHTVTRLAGAGTAAATAHHMEYTPRT